MARQPTTPPPDPMDTPNEGGAYTMDPATGKLSKDGRTEQTAEPRLVVREAFEEEPAPQPRAVAADQKDDRQ